MITILIRFAILLKILWSDRVQMKKKVSVAMVTYNHEKYISEAIESVLMQEADFDFELIISDDFSKDNTRGILLNYQNKYPEKIRLILNNENIGAQINFANLIQSCDGEYIAILDGDDYWIDKKKLQHQVDYLDKNMDCVICWTKAKIKSEDNEFAPYISHNSDYYMRKHSIEELIYCNYFITATVVFRNNLFGVIPKWFYELPMGDYPLNLLNAYHGKIGYVDGVTAVYRVHKNGIWSTYRKKLEVRNIKKYIEMYLNINKEFNYEFINDIYLVIFFKLVRLQEIYKLRLKKYNEEFELLNSILFMLNQNIKVNDYYKNKAYFIFGSGEAAKKTLPTLEHLNICLNNCLDNNKLNWGLLINNLEITSPKVLLKQNLEEVVVIICSMYREEITNQLLEIGLVIKNIVHYSELKELLEFKGKDTNIMEIENKIFKLLKKESELLNFEV